MTILQTSEVIMTDNYNSPITTDMFHRYAEEQIGGKLHSKYMKMDFQHWTKERWDIAINAKIQSENKKYWISHTVLIDR